MDPGYCHTTTYTVSKQLVNGHNNFIIRKDVENRGSTGIMKFKMSEFLEYNKTLDTYNVQNKFLNKN